MPAAAAAEFAQRLERWGYGTLWLPEAAGRNVLVHSSWLLANTTRMAIATGIANIYARDAVAMRTAQYALAEQSGGRFLLGLGVSHMPFVEGVHGLNYSTKPVATMRAYLEAMAAIQPQAAQPAEKPKTVLAALGPKMLELSASHADGAHPYNVTPEHTAEARAVMGPGKLLCTEQMVLRITDPAEARATARKALTLYMTLPNYLNNFKRLGFSDDDLANGGSDRLMDAIVAWGDERAIQARIQAHWDAGADHVCIQALSRTDPPFAPPDEELLAALAPAG
jgi:probable F420-dependent oxidoreductase